MNFDIFFDLGLIRRSLLHVDHGTSVGEVILRVALSCIERMSFVGIKASCEIITINDTENSAINIEIVSEIKIGPRVVLRLIIGKR